MFKLVKVSRLDGRFLITHRATDVEGVGDMRFDTQISLI